MYEMHWSAFQRHPPPHRCSYQKLLWKYAISIKLKSNFIEITLRHGCSPVNLLHIFKTPMESYFWRFVFNIRAFIEILVLLSNELGAVEIKAKWNITNKLKKSYLNNSTDVYSNDDNNLCNLFSDRLNRSMVTINSLSFHLPQYFPKFEPRMLNNQSVS